MIITTIVTMALMAQASVKATHVSAPAQIGTINADKLKGEPTELAWSPDASKLFLQTSQRNGQGMITNPRYFVMAAADAKPEPVAAKPDWASDYWSWKSDKFAPGSKTWALDVKEDERTQSATAAPMGGALAKGGSAGAGSNGTSVEEATLHASQMQRLHVFTVTLKGETVGEFVNQQFLPGYTFSWSPQPLGAIAYVNTSGRLVLMDQQGQKQQVEATKNVLLPAWSADGTQIAFLQRTGKNQYDLCVVKVTQ
jgi:lipopolysaccharide export system protein LptC